MGPIAKKIARGACVVAALYAGVCLCASLVYRRFLYPAPRDPTLDARRVDDELWSVRARDGTTVHALHIGGRNDKKTAHYVVFFHGNGERIQQEEGIADELAVQGLDVVLAEYRGYGISRDDGAPSEAGIYLDAEAVLDALEARGVPKERVTLWGWSLGTGVATEMALRGRASALVLFAPFTSIPNVAARWVPGLPMSLIVRDRFASIEKAKNVSVPTLVVHGTSDHVVPYDMGVTLSHAFPNARLITVDGGEHMDLLNRDPALFAEVAKLALGDATP